MQNIPYTEEAYTLLHEGAIALAQVEANGIRIDTKYLDATIEKIKSRIVRFKKRLQKTEVAKTWRKEYGKTINFNSGEQLGHILFDIMGHDCPAYTPRGKYKTDETTLASVDDPFIKELLRIKKFQKLLTTNLIGLHREVVNGFLHSFFNLHLVKTFRSSSDSINFQNIPVRDPIFAKLIRQAFIPRPGRRIVELDYSGIEVCVSACLHKDPRMQEYLEDKTKDMHRDMAMECYILSLKQLTPSNKNNQDEVTRAKNIRYCGKNCFIFPQFYGDWYIKCAKALWDAIVTMNLHRRDGVSLQDHLRSKGIMELGSLDPSEDTRPGTFVHHIQKVERNFWTKRFAVYDQWRRDWVAKYKTRGWMKTVTGFICQGPLTRNEIMNYPVQGPAFHCLLWALIRLQKKLKKARMKSLIVGQIHDSAIGDVPDDELQDYLGMAYEVMVDDLKNAWSWITVPIEVEAEVTPIDGNWYQKKEIEIGN